MLAYRRKTKSDEIVDPSEFNIGRIVWVDGPKGREEQVCVGPYREPVTRAEYRRQKRGLAPRVPVPSAEVMDMALTDQRAERWGIFPV